MKSYLLFGDTYYAAGGMNDYIGDFETIKEAEEYAKKKLAD
jgi:hypothetical protein